MKRKIFSILFALVLVLSFSLMTAVPAWASSPPIWHTADQQTSSGTNTTGSVARPTNLAEGDLVILIVAKTTSLDEESAGITPPTGFTLIRSEHDTGSTERPEALAYWKIATATEPDTYTFTVLHDYPQWKAIVGRVTGHDAANPIGNDNGVNSGENDTLESLAIPEITTSKDKVLLLAAVAATGSPGTFPADFQIPDGMDELWTADGTWTGGWDKEPGTGVAKQDLAMAGATGTRTFAWTNTSWAAGLMFETLPIDTYDLTMAADPAVGGTATDLTNESPYAEGTEVSIKAVAAADYYFVNWTAPAGVFGNATAAETTFTMPAQDVTVTANFEEVYPRVTPKATTNIATNSATLNMNYTMGNYTSVDVRFAYKKSPATEWSYTPWESKSVSGTYAKSLTGLTSDTRYEFKAQLEYNDTEIIEGATRHFTTTTPPNPPPSGVGCFIATVAYGTPTAEQLDVLREFRDVVLLESTAGSQFVALYYQLSPPVAEFIAENELLRTLVRELLVDPIVWMVEATGPIWRN